MNCLNPTCDNHLKDLGTTKFCPECGRPTGNPEPQSLTCPSAGCANYSKDLGKMKFCPDCGTTTVPATGNPARKDPPNTFVSPAASPPLATPGVPLPSGYAAYQGERVGRSIVAGDQNITHSTVVHNQDQTKQVRQCAVSGRQAEVTRGHVCPSCGLWVHEDHFDRSLMRCDCCRDAQAQRARDQFRSKVREFLADGVLTQEELSELRGIGGRLSLSIPEQDTIIGQAKTELANSGSAPRSMSLIDQTRLKGVLRAVENKVFSTDPVAARGHLESLRALHRSYSSNDLVASLLVFVLTEMMFDHPSETIHEIEQVLRAPCFEHDTPRKYLIRAIFHRGASILALAEVPHSGGEGNWTEYMQQSSEGLRQAASALENMFPNSEECHAIQVAMMIDTYHASGDETIREDINLLLEGAAAAASDSDIGLALKAAHANASAGLEWGEERVVPPGDGLATSFFADLFEFNLVSLRTFINNAVLDSEIDSTDDDLENSLDFEDSGDTSRFEITEEEHEEFRNGERSLIPEDVKSIVSKFKGRLNDSNIYFWDSIPLKKEANARKSMGCLMPTVEVLVLFDNTVFGSAKDGAIITESGVYYNNGSGSPGFVSFSDIKEPKADNGINRKILLNTNHYIYSGCMGKETNIAFTEMLESLCNWRVNEKQAQPFMQKPNDAGVGVSHDENAVQSLLRDALLKLYIPSGEARPEADNLMIDLESRAKNDIICQITNGTVNVVRSGSEDSSWNHPGGEDDWFLHNVCFNTLDDFPGGYIEDYQMGKYFTIQHEQTSIDSLVCALEKILINFHSAAIKAPNDLRYDCAAID
jgi:hypothetical protein